MCKKSFFLNEKERIYKRKKGWKKKQEEEEDVIVKKGAVNTGSRACVCIRANKV